MRPSKRSALVNIETLYLSEYASDSLKSAINAKIILYLMVKYHAYLGIIPEIFLDFFMVILGFYKIPIGNAGVEIDYLMLLCHLTQTHVCRNVSK